MSIGKKIKEYRSEKKISQAELASILLVSRQTISNWENDKTRPEMENLVLLCKFFNVPLDVFLLEDITEIDSKHTELTFTAKIVFVVFILIAILIFSIFLSVKISNIFLIIPFLILDVILFCLLIFFLRNTGEHSYLKKVSKLSFFVIIFVISSVSFFSVYLLLSLL